MRSQCRELSSPLHVSIFISTLRDFRLPRYFQMDDAGWSSNTSATKVIGTWACFEARKAVTSPHKERTGECFLSSGGRCTFPLCFTGCITVRLVTVIWSTFLFTIVIIVSALSRLCSPFCSFFFIHFFYDSAPTVEFFDVIQIARCASFFLKFHTNVCLYYFITRYYIFANHRAVNIIFFHN